MAEKILAKLDILNKQAMLISARRIKENRLQSQIKKKSSVIPLTFDFDFEETVGTSTQKTAPKITEDKICGIDKTKRRVSFKTELEPRKSNFEKLSLRSHFLPTNISQEIKSKEPEEENMKRRSNRSLYFLKDKAEVKYAKHDIYSHHSQACRRRLSSTIFSPVSCVKSNAYKKGKDSILFTAHTERKTSESTDLVDNLENYENKRRESLPQMSDYITEESKYIKKHQLNNDSSVKLKNLLPLCFEDELKKPNVKIIDIIPAKTETSHMEQHDTNPIIFHETGYIKMLLLTKHRFPSIVQNGNPYPYKKRNLILERNHEFLKSLINDQFITPSKIKRTASAACKKDIPATTEKKYRVVNDTLRKKTRKCTLENLSWNKSNNFSQTFTSLQKKIVGLLDKTIIQETDAQPEKFERMFPTVKPLSTQKFSPTPLKYYSRPIKNKLEVHKLNNVTPLDNLLKFPSTS